MTDELIERLEKATGPDRETDCRIWAEVDGRDVTDNDRMVLARSRKPPHDTCVLGYIDPGKVSRNFCAAYSKPEIPTYTSSLDAALTLVPEGLAWSVWDNSQARVYTRTERRQINTDLATFEADDACSPAIALCIAALKARSAQSA